MSAEFRELYAEMQKTALPRHLALQDVANLLRVPRQYVRNWLSGTHECPMNLYGDLLQASLDLAQWLAFFEKRADKHVAKVALKILLDGTEHCE